MMHFQKIKNQSISSQMTTESVDTYFYCKILLIFFPELVISITGREGNYCIILLLQPTFVKPN